jgi:hypothetical protein
LSTSNAFGGTTVLNRGRTDHGNAAEHRNQTELDLEGVHDSVGVVLCRIVKSLNAENSMGTYASLEGVKTGKILSWGMGQHNKPDRAYIDFGRQRRKSSSRHIGLGLNIEWFKCGELRISETHMSPLVPDVKWAEVNKLTPTLPCMQP